MPVLELELARVRVRVRVIPPLVLVLVVPTTRQMQLVELLVVLLRQMFQMVYQWTHFRQRI